MGQYMFPIWKRILIFRFLFCLRWVLEYFIFQEINFTVALLHYKNNSFKKYIYNLINEDAEEGTKNSVCELMYS